MSNHPVHPRCPGCEAAIYKTMVPGRRSRTFDPFAYCRNDECDLWDINQSSTRGADERYADWEADKRAAVDQDVTLLPMLSFSRILFALGLTQGELAKLMKIPPATLSKRLKSERISVGSLRDIVEALGATFQYGMVLGGRTFPLDLR